MRALPALFCVFVMSVPATAEVACDKTDAEWVSFADRQSRLSFMMAGVSPASQKEFMIERVSDKNLNLYAVSEKLPDGRRYGVSIETSIKGSETCTYPTNMKSGFLRELPPTWEPFEQDESGGAEE